MDCNKNNILNKVFSSIFMSKSDSHLSQYTTHALLAHMCTSLKCLSPTSKMSELFSSLDRRLVHDVCVCVCVVRMFCYSMWFVFILSTYVHTTHIYSYMMYDVCRQRDMEKMSGVVSTRSSSV